ncbi:MAG: MFS transporter [Nostocoides sp.]
MSDEQASLQRKVVGILASTQVLGGVGYSAGLAVGALLAQDISGSTNLAGLGGTFQVIGGALLAIPMARIMASRGRGPGLAFGYLSAIAGAIGLIAAAVLRNFPLLLAASILFGGASASNNQAGYAATDLATPARRGRDLSLVVWATTIGSVLGPNLVGPSTPIARMLHVPTLAGPYAISCVGLALAVVVLVVRLRPDPLLEARRYAAAEVTDDVPGVLHGSVTRGLRFATTHPGALLGLLTLALGHAVMVSVMIMTPVHMHEGHAALTVIGLVISIHIVGMYAFSPLVGLAVDRLGGRPVALVGSAILVVATFLASTTPMGESGILTLALFLLGLGWSCTYVSGSTMLTAATPTAERPGVQGASTLVMGLAGGGGGALGGYVVGHFSYQALSLASVVIAISVGVMVLSIPKPEPAV